MCRLLPVQRSFCHSCVSVLPNGKHPRTEDSPYETPYETPHETPHETPIKSRRTRMKTKRRKGAPPAKTLNVTLGKGSSAKVNESCLAGYQLKEVLGTGAYGSVASACLEDDCKYAVKILLTSQVNQRELDIIKQLSDEGIGAKFIDSWTCPATVNYQGRVMRNRVFGHAHCDRKMGRRASNRCVPTRRALAKVVQRNRKIAQSRVCARRYFGKKCPRQKKSRSNR